jgi:hypothetical protein
LPGLIDCELACTHAVLALFAARVHALMQKLGAARVGQLVELFFRQECFIILGFEVPANTARIFGDISDRRAFLQATVAF